MKIFIILFVIFTIINTVTFVISMYKIFEKENIKNWYAFIPFYNVYFYFKICRIPFITFFMPVGNLGVFLFASYNLAKYYQADKKMCYLAVIFPYIVMPYIAFSDMHSKQEVIFNYIKSGHDVDKLDHDLIADEREVDIQEKVAPANSNSPIPENKTDILIDSMTHYDTDDIVDDDNNDIIPTNKKSDEAIDNSVMYEISDDFIVDETMNASDIDKIEDNLKVATSVEKNIVTDIKDYQQVGPTNEAIAFGGKEQIENVSEAKVEELKCPRCGSSLIGANGYCPGCGQKI